MKANGNKNGASASAITYWFDDFEIDPSNRVCARGDELVPLTGKVFDILLTFLENPDRLLRKDELLQRIWKEAFVEEGNLTRNISTLRKALGDNGRERRYIATVPGHGYRFVADISLGTRNAEAHLQGSSAPIKDQASTESFLEQKRISTLTNSRSPVGSRRGPIHNLRQPRSRIIGREKEIRNVEDLLFRDDVRLVTLTGTGGTGKTTLAQAVARSVLPKFSDGVIYIELGNISDPNLVASAIARPLGVKETGTKSVSEILKATLIEKRILFVIDNFEHVIDAAWQIADLIAENDNIKILITSRELLRLSCEHEFSVPPLGLPVEDVELLPDELANCEAVKLFVDRAKNVRAGFGLTVENAECIAEICIRLDGLPLAIELAAARVKILSPQDILTKLESRLKFLTGGARDLPTRQQTIRNTVAWSFDLLNEPEKRLFRRLAVFVGGFTLETADAICMRGESGKEPVELIDLITSLNNKSLLSIREQSDGQVRFQMLEIVREYANEYLAASGEQTETRERHASYFVALGEEAEPYLQNARAGEWLARLENEHGNLRVAFQWAFENEPEMAARLAAGIRVYLINHSHLAEGREWLNAVLERKSEVQASVRFKLLNALGWLAYCQGAYKAAAGVFEEGLFEGRASGNKKQIAESLRGLGAANSPSDSEAARRFAEEGLALHRELNDKFGIACSLNGIAALDLGRGAGAATCLLLNESLTIFRQLGNESGVCYCLLNLGAVACNSGDYDDAQKYYSEVITIAQNLGYKDRIIFCLNGFSEIALKRGELERAARLAGAAEYLRESIGFETDSSCYPDDDTTLTEIKTKMDEADFAKAYAQGRKLKLGRAIALGLGANLERPRKEFGDV